MVVFCAVKAIARKGFPNKRPVLNLDPIEKNPDYGIFAAPKADRQENVVLPTVAAQSKINAGTRLAR